jgi:hypothetical protein
MPYTPGPWKIGPYGQVQSKNNKTLCVLVGDKDRDNAELLRAAPEMFEILEVLAECGSAAPHNVQLKALELIKKVKRRETTQ